MAPCCWRVRCTLKAILWSWTTARGLLTLYLHLSEFKVKEGDQVKRGEIIGLSGGTGRATGPHLHVAVRWQGTYLDPGLLMRLSLP